MEKVTGKPVPDIKFFNMDCIHDRGLQGPRAAPRHGRSAGLGDLRPVGRRRRRPRRDRRGRAGVRHPPGRVAHLPDEHARVGLDPVAAAGRLHRRAHEAVPRVAERARATRPPPRSAAASSRRTSRTTTSRRTTWATARFVQFDHEFIGREALEKIAKKAEEAESHARVERRRRRRVLRHAVPRRQVPEVHRPAARELLDAAVRQDREGRQDGRPSRRTPATASTSARCCRSPSST